MCKGTFGVQISYQVELGVSGLNAPARYKLIKNKIMENKELIDLSIGWFKDVEEKIKTLTTGNVSHNSRSIQGFVHRCAEFLEKHKNDKKLNNSQ